MPGFLPSWRPSSPHFHRRHAFRDHNTFRVRRQLPKPIILPRERFHQSRAKLRNSSRKNLPRRPSSPRTGLPQLHTARNAARPQVQPRPAEREVAEVLELRTCLDSAKTPAPGERVAPNASDPLRKSDALEPGEGEGPGTDLAQALRQLNVPEPRAVLEGRVRDPAEPARQFNEFQTSSLEHPEI